MGYLIEYWFVVWVGNVIGERADEKAVRKKRKNLSLDEGEDEDRAGEVSYSSSITTTRNITLLAYNVKNRNTKNLYRK